MRQTSLMSMTSHAVGFGTWSQRLTIPIYLPSEMHLQNSLTIRNFQAGSWTSKQEFAQKRRISRSYCSESRESKQPARWRTSSIQNQLRKKISLIVKKRIWWWRQKWNEATILFIWSTKLPSVEPWQNKKGEKLWHRAEECFQRKTIGSCSRRDACSFVHACHGRPWGQRGMKWRDARKISPGARILFSTESERNWLTKKLEQSKGQSCDWSWKFLVYGGQDENFRRVIIDSSRVSWLQVWKDMHSWLSSLMSTSWW